MGSVGLLPAAGAARRLGIDTPKELVTANGRPVIDWSVDHLLEAGVDRLVVVTRPGKEAIAEHLERRELQVPITFVEQTGAIGHLIDALRCARSALADDTVHLLFPDTVLSPNPFLGPINDAADGDDNPRDLDRGHRPELLLLCHDAGENWRHFGVVDPGRRRVVEKPTSFCGSICWGAARWESAFSDRLADARDLTAAINEADWRHVVAIEHYRDVGLADPTGT